MNYQEKALDDLRNTDGCVVIEILNHRDKVAYIYSQDHADGKRTYAAMIPRENGDTQLYVPVKDMFMQSELEIVKRAKKAALRVFRDEDKEETDAVEKKVLSNQRERDNEDSTE
jgi:hypothetical protein